MRTTKLPSTWYSTVPMNKPLSPASVTGLGKVTVVVNQAMYVLGV